MINLLLPLLIIGIVGIAAGFYLCWLVGQEDEPSIFIMDNKQRLEHDRVNEGYPITTYREYSAMAAHSKAQGCFRTKCISQLSGQSITLRACQRRFKSCRVFIAIKEEPLRQLKVFFYGDNIDDEWLMRHVSVDCHDPTRTVTITIDNINEQELEWFKEQLISTPVCLVYGAFFCAIIEKTQRITK